MLAVGCELAAADTCLRVADAANEQDVRFMVSLQTLCTGTGTDTVRSLDVDKL